MLVVADTHWTEPPEHHGLPLQDHDVVVHAGDHVSRESLALYDDVELHAVRGNADEADLEASLPAETAFDLGGVDVGVVHGHRQRSEDELRYLALDLGVDLLVHGHSHTPRFDGSGGAALLDPGSPTRPRGGFPATYVQVEAGDGVVAGEFVETESREVYGSFETDFTVEEEM